MSLFQSLVDGGWIVCPNCESNAIDTDMAMFKKMNGYEHAIVCYDCGHKDRVDEVGVLDVNQKKVES